MPALHGKSDVALLLDFSRGKSHAAFEALVQRHGPMVHGVARRVLSNHHDAQDVAQATFLVLAREASKLSKGDCLAGWLHTVARRLSLNALKSRSARETREQVSMEESSSTATTSAELEADFGRELDAALSCLPEHYRQPLVLFHLEGASIEEASQRLKLHSGTFRTRLGRARALLRDALVKRGVQVASVSVLAGMLATESKAAELGSSGAQGISQAVLGHGATGSGAQALANGLTAVPYLSGGTFSTSLIILMTSKSNIIAAAIIAMAAMFTAIKLIPDQSSADAREDQKNNRPRLAQRDPSSSAARLRSGKAGEFSFRQVSSPSDMRRLFVSVFMIADEDERLQAIRQRLGMNISGEVYRSALDECRYSTNYKNHLGSLCEKWAEVDGQALVEWTDMFNKEPDSRLENEIEHLKRKLFSGWLSVNEAAAMKWGATNFEAQQLEEIRRGMESRDRAVPAASAEEIPAMLASMHAEQQSAGKRTDLNLVIKYLGHKNPDATFKFLEANDLIGSYEYTHDIQSFFRRWGERDPDAALAALSTIEKGQLRSDAMVDVLQSWQAKHPSRYLDEVADFEELSDGQFDRLKVSVAAIVARSNPESAMERVWQEKNPEVKQQMLNEVTEVWASLNPQEAEQWVVALPQGTRRDMGLEAMGSAVSSYDIGKGADLISQISEPERMHAAARTALGRTFIVGGEIEGGMRMADLLPTIPAGDMERYAISGKLEEMPAMLAWFKKRREEGRIAKEDELDADRVIRSLEERLEKKE